MSLFGETCESSRVLTSEGLFTTPCGFDVRDMQTRYSQGGTPLPMQAHSTSSPPATPASHSLSPGSDWARRMTATYGRKFADWYLRSGPVDACLRTLLGTSTWASMTCWLTWKKSATPQGRLLFRLVPSAPRTAGIGSGLLHTPTVTANQESPSMVNRDPGSWRLWGTPTSRDHKDTGDMTNVPVNGLLGRQVLMPTPRVEGFDAGMHRGKPDSLHSYAKLWPTPRASENENRTTKPAPSHGNGHGKVLAGEVGQTSSMKLNSAWVSRMMGYPDGWMDVGEETP
jgi:hypothetical protein